MIQAVQNRGARPSSERRADVFPLLSCVVAVASLFGAPRGALADDAAPAQPSPASSASASTSTRRDAATAL
ncbi:hypothetical protein, partial [Burkholderia sp. Ac-20379]|uniref:hypothetical protein n=1 Tax=Burkholderia sp. Ac-20379 TaxID=2703900 RepID=UPI00197DE2B7